MFGQAGAGVHPDPPAQQAAWEALDVLAAAIRRGVRAGVFPPRSTRRLTLAAWALVHGLVSLELDGKLPPGGRPAADYQAILRATVTGWQHEPTVNGRQPA
jgi:hypothetical protein